MSIQIVNRQLIKHCQIFKHAEKLLTRTGLPTREITRMPAMLFSCFQTASLDNIIFRQATKQHNDLNIGL